MNSVNLIGRLVKDVDLTYTPNGTAVAKFVLAVKRKFPNPTSGEYESDFIKCIAIKKKAETLANYTEKGLRVGITGNLQTRNYEDENKKMHYVTEVFVEDTTLIERKSRPQ
ncbi:single-stranded DNA-binding protein [Bacillus cereus]|nr:single-stranded DNA-binding protein [Bacillus cereus]